MSLNDGIGEDGFPWAWYKAFNAIVNERPLSDIPTPPVEILPWLYLAPIFSVYGKAETLSCDLGITHVLSTNRMPPSKMETLYWELRSNGIDHCYVAAEDRLSYDMMSHWNECRVFLQECTQSKNSRTAGHCDADCGLPLSGERLRKCLVHCAAGMNRSGTIAAAAMIHFEKMDLLQVARILKDKRGYVLNNSSFVKQLVMFAAKEGRLGEKPLGYNDEPPLGDEEYSTILV